MTNVIVLLYDLKSAPNSLNVWTDNCGIRWRADLRASSNCVAKALIDSYDNLRFVEASGHFDGGGLQHGVEWSSTLATLRSSKTEPKVKATITTIMVACMWPAQHINSISSSHPTICPRCLCGSESSIHTFWQCPANNDSDSDIIRNTNHLSDLAVSDIGHPCIWTRGVLPLDLVPIDSEFQPSDNPDVIYFDKLLILMTLLRINGALMYIMGMDRAGNSLDIRH